MLSIMVILPYFFSRDIALGIQKPYKSKIDKIYVLYAGLVLFFGGSAYRNALYTSNADAYALAILGFAIAILFLFITPALLIKPKEMDEIMKE